MARYTINIELRVTNKEKLERLNLLMIENGFMDTLYDAHGNTLILPKNTYVCISLLSSIKLVEKIYDIVREMEIKPIIFVTKSTGRAWKGLHTLDMKVYKEFIEKL